MRSEEECLNRGDWMFISLTPGLTEESIEKNSDRVDWHVVGMHQNLSDSFIIKHIDKLGLENILQFQKITKKLINELKHKFNCNLFIKLLENNKLSKETRKTILDSCLEVFSNNCE